MRNKVITFCAAMGIPISSWGSTLAAPVFVAAAS